MKDEKKDRNESTYKERIQKEWEKVKPLSGKEKLSYIWDYYKIVFVGLLFLVLVIGIGVQMYKGSKQKEYLYSLVLNTDTIGGEPIEFLESYKQELGLNPKKQKLTVDTSVQLYLEEEVRSQGSMASYAKLVTLLGAGQIDIMISPEDVYRKYASSGAFYNLEDVLPKELYERTKIDLYTEHLESSQEEQEFTEEQESIEEPFGIDISKAPNYKADGSISYHPVILSISRSTKNLDHAIELLTYLYGDGE